MSGVSIGTWWRTVRHLKARQIIGRAFFRMRVPKPVLDAAPARRLNSAEWQPPARREQSFFPPDRFRFLGRELVIEGSDWNPSQASKLWLYNLHYFDVLNANRSAEIDTELRTLVSRWIAANRPATGPGWEPYPVSIRLVNWAKWFLGGADPEPAWLHSMAVQARWLRRRMEFHLLGNHLIANAKAIVFSGAFFSGKEAQEWIRCGARILDRELDEQILSDGGQFELSPMYHSLALEDVLDLINLIGTFGEISPLDGLLPTLRNKAEQMMSWLRHLEHPGGELALFNDCSPGIAATRLELEDYARRLGLAIPAALSGGKPIVHLSESGYIRIARGRVTAILDVARVGPSYLPAHAHADTLSFELSLGNKRVIANGGTSSYEMGERRFYERSTAAHNTVELESQSSSEVWGSFRVGRRAEPFGLQVSDSVVTCSHNGFRHLRGRPVHQRMWTFSESSLSIEDRISPPVEGRARFFLAQGLRYSRLSVDSWNILDHSQILLSVRVISGEGHDARVEQAQSFGLTANVECLLVDLIDGRARTEWTWQRFDGAVH